MKFTTRFLSLVLTLALTFSSVVSLSIRIDGNGVVSTSETDILDRSEIRNALMAPRDVELVRRASWTYNNSMFCHIITWPTRPLPCILDKQLLMGIIVQNGGM